MDEHEEALRAWPVAQAASAWRHAVSDTEAYRRLVLATADWDAYVAPTLAQPDDADVSARLRHAARQALHAMDEEQTQRARSVAIAASAWLQAAGDPATYRRFIAAVDAWDDYNAPHLEAPVEELLDELAEISAPRALGELVADVTDRLRKAAGRTQ
jgi:hypothetical protein